MERFSAKLESMSRKRGIVSLYDSAGECAGFYRVEARPRFPLYEVAYLRASQEAAIKGGLLDRFSAP